MFTIAFSTALFGIMPLPWPPVLRSSLATVSIALLLTAAARVWQPAARISVALPGWWRRYGYAALFGISLAARLLLIAVAPLAPVSDYLLYLNTAKGLLSGDIPPWEPYTVVIAPNVWAYGIVLSGWMSIFGATLLSAQVFVALCFSGTTMLFYAVARRMVAPATAAAAALWVALSPETLLYTRAIGNEAISMFLLMLGFLCLLVLRYPRGNVSAAILILLAGVSLAACQAIRPIAALAWLPMGFYYFRIQREKRRYLCQFLTALLVFIGCCTALDCLRAQAFGAAVPPSPGWTLYEGLDLAGKGQWSPEKNKMMKQLLRELPAAQVQPKLLRLAWERVRAYTPSRWLTLFAVKLSSLWSDCGYLFVDSFLRHIPAVALATACLWAQGLLLGSSAFVKKTSNNNDSLFLCLSPIVLLSVFCLFGTSINRYHFVALPFLALALSIQGERISAEKGLRQV